VIAEAMILKPVAKAPDVSSAAGIIWYQMACLE
jgi:hypothetical protein